MLTSSNARNLVDIENLKLDEAFNNLDQSLKDHCHKVADLSLALSKELDDDINEMDLYRSALYHDIGKMMICRSIRDKPAKLTREEMDIMKLHAKYSAQLLSNCGEANSVIVPIMLHHENYDGSGYPLRHEGERIPINARIIRIADSYAALNAKRSYKDAFITDKCIEILERESHMYDPRLLRIFIEKVI
jgi:putative nucleotidyltransferase with HDIG domain